MTQRKQVFDGIIQFWFAKLNTKPFFLIHVIGWKIAVLPAKRADQQRITFHINDINDACLRQSQLISGYFQNYAISNLPLSANLLKISHIGESLFALIMC